MLPRHTLPQLVPNRVASTLKRLEALIWHSPTPLAVEATSPREEHLTWTRARRLPRRPVRAGQPWGRLYDQRWCRLRLPAVEDRPCPTRYLEWQDQGEATLHIDGVPYYGFDVAHRRVALPATAREVWVEAICVQTGIWHPAATGISPQGSVFTGARLLQRDDEAWHAWHDLACLNDLMHVERPGGAKLNAFGQQTPLTTATPFQRQLLRALDEATDAFETGGPPALRASLFLAYRELRRSQTYVRACLTGHAHIDLVWLWPENVGEAKAVHTFATANRLMQLYPEFRFAYSQPASYAAVGRRAPALLDEVKRQLATGRWEATGALYVESDTLLPCGEALARSFILGQEDFARLRGSPSRLLWLPDVFGYSGCLPQLMRLSGVDSFFTTKLTWSAINRFPYSSFRWRGTDGSEVVAHVTQGVGYNNNVRIAELHEAANGHSQVDVHREFLHPTGYGDGGGGPTEEMCERARRLDALPGLPAIGWEQPEAFFGRLHDLRDRLPVYQGECYLEYHRGTYTTHGDLKLAFRALERALQTREAVATALGRPVDLGAAWRRLVFAQFHDYIPGSSIPEVYAQGLPELRRLAAEQLTASTRALGRARGDACLFNPLPLTRRCWWHDRLVDLPPLAGVRLKDATVHPNDRPEASALTLRNNRVAVTFTTLGEIERLVIDDTEVPLTGSAGGLVLYPDRAANFEAWDIDRHVLTLGQKVASEVKFQHDNHASGQRAVLSVERKLGHASSILLRYVLEAASPVLRVEIDLDWHEPEMLLKWRLPTGYRGPDVRCGAPFGTVQRPQQPGPLAAEAMWEIPVSRHLTVTDDGGQRGLCVLTEAKYGVSCQSGDIGVSLVRSPRITGHEGHGGARPSALSRLQLDSIYTDQGRHHIALAVAAYDARSPREQQPAALAETLFTPPVAYRGAPVASCLPAFVGGDTLVPAWVVPGRDGGHTLRLHEVGGERGVVRWEDASGGQWHKVDLRDEVLAEVDPAAGLPYRPNEIVSLRFTPAAPRPRRSAPPTRRAS